MNILFATQGKYGERIVEYIAANRPQEWKILRLPLRRNLPAVIDDPEEVLPATVPAADLLVSLHESPGAAELIPDIAQRCGAVAVLAAVDDRAACPTGAGEPDRKAARGDGGRVFLRKAAVRVRRRAAPAAVGLRGAVRPPECGSTPTGTGSAA